MNSSPCAKLTTSMMPKISVRPEAISARIMPVTMPLTVWIRTWSSGKPWMICTSIVIARPWLDPEILLDDGIAPAQARRRRVVADRTLLHEVDALACLEGKRHVLLDQEDGDALLVQRRDDGADLRHH